MHKGDLVNVVRAKLGSAKAADDAVNAVLDAIQTALEGSEDVILTGFGTFKVVKVEGRDYHGINGGKTVHRAAHKKVSFRAGTELRRAVDPTAQAKS